MVNIIANHEGLGTFNRFNTPSFLSENYEENTQNPLYLLYVTYMTKKTTVIWYMTYMSLRLLKRWKWWRIQRTESSLWQMFIKIGIQHRIRILDTSNFILGEWTNNLNRLPLQKWQVWELAQKKTLYHSPLAVCRGNDAKYYIILFRFDPMTPNLSKSTGYHRIPFSCKQFRTNIPSVASANKKKACSFRISRLTLATSSH